MCTYLSPERQRLKEAEDEVKKCKMAIRMRQNEIRRLRDTRYKWRFDYIRKVIAEIGQWQLRLHKAEVDLRRVIRTYYEEE